LWVEACMLVCDLNLLDYCGWDLLEGTRTSVAETSMDPNVKLWGQGNVPVDIWRYRMLIRKLIYLANTHPDIAFPVSGVRQFMHSPSLWRTPEAIYKILRYLKALLEKVFILKKKKTSERNVSILLLSRQRQLQIESPLQKNKGVMQNSNLEQRPKEFKKGFEIYRVIQKFKRTVELPLKLYCVTGQSTLNLTATSLKRNWNIKLSAHPLCVLNK
jgi:tRNA/tmRNA/rRNA uracil-C5-methylase (TrmA/RlmC/RlmD family)